jgi:DNA-binding NarL/FixJ family response regulator
MVNGRLTGMVRTVSDPVKTPIVVVDNDAFTRSTVAAALEGRGHRVLGSYPDARSCLTGVADLPVTPEVAVLDLDLGVGPNGIDVATALRSRIPRIGLVMLTHYRDPRLLTVEIPRWPPGMRYLAKSDIDDVGVLVTAIVSARESPMRVPRGTSMPDADLAVLTGTQIEVLRAVAQGYSTPEIARMRGVSVKAVEKVITRICEQLDLPRAATHNQRVQLVRAFVRMTGQGDAIPPASDAVADSS